MAMDPSLLQALVEQAAAAEARLSQIENKIKGEHSTLLSVPVSFASFSSLFWGARAPHVYLSLTFADASCV